MGKMEKNRKENHATKVTKVPKTKRRKYGMNETEVYSVPNFLMTNSYQDIEFGRFVYFFIRAGQFCTQKYWKRIGRKNTMIGINVPKVKNKIKVTIFWESQKKFF